MVSYMEKVEGRIIKVSVDRYVKHSKTYHLSLSNKHNVKVKLEYFDFVIYNPAIHDKIHAQVRSSARLHIKN